MQRAAIENFYRQPPSQSQLFSDYGNHYLQYQFGQPHVSRSPFEMMSMDEQERKKLERKRARNRQAASKCRQKKMERISELEQQVTNEKQRAARLDIELDQLQRALNDMQSLIASHSNRGCQSPHSQHRH